MQICSVVCASLPARLFHIPSRKLILGPQLQLPFLTRGSTRRDISAGWCIRSSRTASSDYERRDSEVLDPVVTSPREGTLSTRTTSSFVRPPVITPIDDSLKNFPIRGKVVIGILESEPGTAAGGMASGEWECRKCTFLNDEGLESCELCDQAREHHGAEAAGQSEEGKKRKRDADELTGIASARPSLQVPSSRVPKLDESRRTVIVLDDDDSPAPKAGKRPLPDDTRESSQGASSAGEGRSSLLHDLHLERLARQTARQEGASGDASTSSRPCREQEKAFFSSSRGAGVPSAGLERERAGSSSFARPDLDDEDFESHKSTRVFGRGVSNQAAPTGVGSQESLVILSYNVWFNEQVALERRMGAIGAIIEEHSPHVVFFQEVTPNIYSIFRQARWWARLGYKCSLSPSQIDRQYFAMMVTRLPVKSAFAHDPFPNSVMGRDLVTASVAVGNDVELTLATTHLESPTGKDQMFSEPRVAQARSALASLARKRNVIFGGDMNWDDARDGPVPLPDGWIDPWLELHRGQPGYTYDSVLNQMLLGNLKGRLDRFLCRLPDFTVQSVEMMGKQPIPGLTYEKPGWGRFPKSKTLPVLPSDHFGLLLKLARKGG